MKERIYEIIEKGSKDDKISLTFDRFIVMLVILNIFAIVLESFEPLKLRYEYAFRTFEYISIFIFSVEYLLRLWTAELKFKGRNKLSSLVKYIISPIALIDLISILPSYLPMFFHFDLRILRIFKLSKLLRVLKLNRYSNSMNTLARVLKKEKDVLTLTVFITFMLMLIASTIMYVIENEVQPEAFPDILASFWWAIATLTTVGYGDIYPVTALGKFLSGVIALLGIGLVALPTGIISSGFLSELNTDDNIEEKITHMKCPNCGTHIVEVVRERSN